MDTAHAYEQVQRAYSDYTFALDANDAAGVASCFAEDGSWEISGRAPLVGHAAIEAFVEETSSDRPRHHYANLGITGSGNGGVRSRAYFFLVSRTSGALLAYGAYDDELVAGAAADGRQPRLVFARRGIEFLWMSEAYAARGRAGRSAASPA